MQFKDVFSRLVFVLDDCMFVSLFRSKEFGCSVDCFYIWLVVYLVDCWFICWLTGLLVGRLAA